MSSCTSKSALKSAVASIVTVASLFGAAAAAGAQALQASPQIAARLTQPIDESSLVTLRGNTHPLAKAKYDQGPAPTSLPSSRMLLVLKRSAQQETNLKSYLDQLQTPGSPNYHKFITPEQFGALYGPADSDVQTVSTWLQGHGFAIAKVSKAKSAIEFSGSVGQVDTAFHTSIHSYLVNGEQHYANASDPQIPAALAPVVAGLSRMNNFKAKSNVKVAPRGVYDATTKTFKPSVNTSISPSLTAGSGTNQFLYVGPADAATIYDSPNAALNKNFGGGTTYDGTGVTIGIAIDGNINLASIAAYRAFFGLPISVPNVVVDGDDPGVGDIENSSTGEATLDTELSGGLAPGAKINLYVAAANTLQDGFDLAILRALDDNDVSILSNSFGECELGLGTSGNAFVLSEWEEAAAQGITVLVSTGDSGSAGCDDDNTETQAQYGLQVEGTASTPYNIAVGGTDFDTLQGNFSTYVGASNSSPYYGTAIGYIPENPWNNSTTVNTSLTSNLAYLDANGNPNIVAAGGGASSCVSTDSTGTLCLGGYAKPSWQQLFDNGDGVRDVPDVSLFASNGFYGATWGVCAVGTEGGTTTNDCVLPISSATTISGFGGTSTSTPAFAGILALVSQKVGTRLGQANQVIYPLAKQNPAIFHDVTTGNISVPCVTGTADCGSNGFLTGYNASAGYDLATGLGSVDITKLINAWSSITFAGSSTALTLNGATAPITITHGTNVSVGVTVTSSSGTPTGDVSVNDTLDPVANPNNASVTADLLQPITLASGTGSATINALPGGTYNVIAHYGGNGTISGSDSNPVPVVVNPENSTLNLQIAAYDPSTGNQVTSSTAPYGFYVAVDANPVGVNAGSSGFDGIGTGTITFSGAASKTGNLNAEGFSELLTTTLPAGNQTISAAYSGDKSFNASTGSTSFTITQGQTATTATFTLTASGSALPRSNDLPTIKGFGWYGAGGAALACAVFFGIPARRRSWKAMLAVIAFASIFTGCGGGSGSSSSGGGGGGGSTTAVYTASAVVTTDSAGVAPTGTITFNSGSTKLGTATLTGGTDSTTGLVNATATGSITLSSGVNSVTASYSGDTNYSGSTSGASSITVASAKAALR